MTAPTSKTRVLVVDDSAFARKVIREVLSGDPEIEVVDIARDGLEALEKIDALRPDVVTLDLMMPELDGLGVLRALAGRSEPKVVVVSFSDADSEAGAEALQLGALDLVKKPTALASDRMFELSGELREKVRALRVAKTPPPLEQVPVAAPAVTAAFSTRFKLVAVGTSTGGPQALTRFFTGLPASLPVPVTVALHIPPGYTDALARRLDDTCAVHVVEAKEGQPLAPGIVYVAPGGLHLTVRARGEELVAALSVRPIEATYTPSVDVLFASAAAAVGGACVGVVLTGMGDDGREGAKAIRAAGGRIITESPATSVIDGMPRAIREAGLSDAEAPIDQIAARLLHELQSG